MIEDQPSPDDQPTARWQRTRGIMARSFYRELRDNGLTNQQVVELSTQLLQLVSTDLELEQQREPTKKPGK